MKETQIAQCLINYLDSDEIYKEVKYKAGVIDVVVKEEISFSKKVLEQNPAAREINGRQQVHGIECKTCLNIEVLMQAHRAKECVDLASICVPRSKQKSRRFGLKIARDYGIGVYEVSRFAPLNDEDLRSVSQVVPPTPNHEKEYDLKLYEKQKVYSKAGSNNTKIWTPFQQTRYNLEHLVKRKPGIRLESAVKALDHHYSNKKSAKSSIRSHIKRRIINLRIEENRLYPLEDSENT